MIYSQPNRRKLNLEFTYFKNILQLANGEALAASRTFPCVNIQNKYSNILFASIFALVRTFEQNKQNIQHRGWTMDERESGQIACLD